MGEIDKNFKTFLEEIHQSKNLLQEPEMPNQFANGWGTMNFNPQMVKHEDVDIKFSRLYWNKHTVEDYNETPEKLKLNLLKIAQKHKVSLDISLKFFGILNPDRCGIVFRIVHIKNQ